MALILNPLVRMLERIQVPRGLAIPTVYLGWVAVIVGIGVALSEPISNQVSHFQDDVPHLVVGQPDAGQPPEVARRPRDQRPYRAAGPDGAADAPEGRLKRRATSSRSRGDLLQQLVTVGFDLVLMFVLSIYMLIYGKQIGELVRS